MKKLLKDFQFYDFLTIAFLVYLAGANIITGTAIVFTPNDLILQSERYMLMVQLFSLEFYRISFIVTGLIIAIGTFLYNGKERLVLLIFSGMIGSFIWTIYAFATHEALVMKTLGYRFAWIGLFHLLLVLAGGIELWKRKT